MAASGGNWKGEFFIPKASGVVHNTYFGPVYESSFKTQAKINAKYALYNTPDAPSRRGMTERDWLKREEEFQYNMLRRSYGIGND